MTQYILTVWRTHNGVTRPLRLMQCNSSPPEMLYLGYAENHKRRVDGYWVRGRTRNKRGIWFTTRNTYPMFGRTRSNAGIWYTRKQEWFHFDEAGS